VIAQHEGRAQLERQRLQLQKQEGA